MVFLNKLQNLIWVPQYHQVNMEFRFLWEFLFVVVSIMLPQLSVLVFLFTVKTALRVFWFCSGCVVRLLNNNVATSSRLVLSSRTSYLQLHKRTQEMYSLSTFQSNFVWSSSSWFTLWMLQLLFSSKEVGWYIEDIPSLKLCWRHS